MDSGIYTIRNRTTGLIYVGSAVCFRVRWNGHKSKLRRGKHPNPHLQASWNVHGEDVFEFNTLEECPVQDLLKREQHWINELKPGYNIARLAGAPMTGRHHSSVTKERMSRSQKGKTHDEQWIERTASAHRGMKRSSETRAKISASAQKRFLSPATRLKISEAVRARRTVEWRTGHARKMRLNWIKRKANGRD